MKSYGYARVSTDMQNLDRQIEQLKTNNLDRIFRDKWTGMDAERPSYVRLKNIVVDGDFVFVTSIDRLGRDMELIKKEIQWFHDHKVKLIFWTYR